MVYNKNNLNPYFSRFHILHNFEKAFPKSAYMAKEPIFFAPWMLQGIPKSQMLEMIDSGC